MLKITIGGEDYYDERTQEFSTVKGFDLVLEHSLVSLSKWESITNKAFLSKEDKSPEELLQYVMCMIVSREYPDNVVDLLTDHNIETIKGYIESPQSATKFGNMPGSSGPNETITSELIYYWMSAFNIPNEYETWHLNRLFTLIRICSIKNSKPKKLSRGELASRNRKLNAERKAQYNTSG
jgi:hypothetical protein